MALLEDIARGIVGGPIAATTDALSDVTGIRSTGDVADRLFGPGGADPRNPQADLDAVLAEMLAGSSGAYDQALAELGSQAEAAPYIGDFAYQDLVAPAALGPSELAGIEQDPRLLELELAALDALQQQADGGLTPQQEADLLRVGQQAAARSRGAREAIQSRLARQGLTGSGLGIVAEQQAAADAIEDQALRELEAQGLRQQAEQRAVAQAGRMAGQMGQRQYGREAEAARANDMIRQFNLQNTLQNQRLNQQGRNAAAMRNLQTQQDLAAQQARAQQALNQARSGIQAGRAGQAMQAGQLQYNSLIDQYNRQLAEKRAADAARAGKISAVTGLLGAGVGGVATGSPQGAAAGAGVGTQLGTLFGGA